MSTFFPPMHVADPMEAPRPSAATAIKELLRNAREFADELAARPSTGAAEAPLVDIESLRQLGVLRAPLPLSLGGLGLGLDPESQRALLELLAILGGADLALGRIIEGHVNALLLLRCFATEDQLERAAADCRAGRLFGVWNTGTPSLMQVVLQSDGSFALQGGKTFATGAEFVTRPIVTAELAGSGWQMTLLRMEDNRVRFDRSFWHPLGMEATESFAVDFSGVTLNRSDLIGAAGDFYRDPLFRGGAIRFAAVQAGAILRLHALLANWLEEHRRGDDPYQLARLGEVAVLAQQAVLWVERSAETAACSLFRDDPVANERMIECANMTRLAIERIAIEVMRFVTMSIGAHGLLQPRPFERILRNLTMYLRQPAPDQTLRSVGIDSLRKVSTRVGGASHGFWSTCTGDDPSGADSLAPSYFDRIYEANADPWNFETSAYESAKYTTTVSSLPREKYANALEIGCSIGVLTAQLAQHTRALLAIDVSALALERAKERCAHLSHVRFAQMQFPDQYPAGLFDLVVVSEVAYYWSRATLKRAMNLIASLQPAGAHLVLVHWTPVVADYPLTGDEVHELWITRPEWRVTHSQRDEQFRLEVLERLPLHTAPDPEVPR